MKNQNNFGEGKFDLQQEWDEVEAALGNTPIASAFSPLRPTSGYASSYFEDTTPYIDDFAKNYNTTGSLASKFKIEKPLGSQPNVAFNNPMGGAMPLQNHQTRPLASANTQEESPVFKEMLQELRTHNQLLAKLVFQVENQHTLSMGQGGNISEDVISELKTNNLYLSRVEHKISQLILSLERVIK